MKRPLIVWVVAIAIAVAFPAAAQPSADDVLAAMGFSDDAKQRILNGEFVTGEVPALSERDLSLVLGFLVKVPPADLAKEVVAGALNKADDQLTGRGEISRAGTLEDFAALRLQPGATDAATAYVSAAGGNALNLDTGEIAAFNALQGQADVVGAVEKQLRAMLLARYQAYRASGLRGIRPYDRGGKTFDPGADLRKASEAPVLKRFFPAMQSLLVGDGGAGVSGLTESFHWANYAIDGKPTYALVHLLSAPDGAGHVVVQRQYYVGRSYDTEQAIAGFVPVEQGTLVVYVNHTFTDQVTGFGGSAKRSIGRRVMAGKLEDIFKKQRAAAAR